MGQILICFQEEMVEEEDEDDHVTFDSTVRELCLELLRDNEILARNNLRLRALLNEKAGLL